MYTRIAREICCYCRHSFCLYSYYKILRDQQHLRDKRNEEYIAPSESFLVRNSNIYICIALMERHIIE